MTSLSFRLNIPVYVWATLVDDYREKLSALSQGLEEVVFIRYSTPVHMVLHVSAVWR